MTISTTCRYKTNFDVGDEVITTARTITSDEKLLPPCMSGTITKIVPGSREGGWLDDVFHVRFNTGCDKYSDVAFRRFGSGLMSKSAKVRTAAMETPPAEPTPEPVTQRQANRDRNAARIGDLESHIAALLEDIAIHNREISKRARDEIAACNIQGDETCTALHRLRDSLRTAAVRLSNDNTIG